MINTQLPQRNEEKEGKECLLFPETAEDKIFCGLLCDLVAGGPCLPASNYLDMLVIVRGHQRGCRLLGKKERTRFAALAKKAFKGVRQKIRKLPWADLIRLLTLQEVLVSANGGLYLGARFREKRPLYPAIDRSLIVLLHQAAETLRDFREFSKGSLNEKAKRANGKEKR